MSLPTNFFIGRGSSLPPYFNSFSTQPDSSYSSSRLGTPSNTMLASVISTFNSVGNDPSFLSSDVDGRVRLAVQAGMTLDVTCIGGRGGKDLPANQKAKLWGYGRKQVVRLTINNDTTLILSPAAQGKDWTTAGDSDNGGSGGGASFVAELSGSQLIPLTVAAGGAGTNPYSSIRSYYNALPYTAKTAYEAAFGAGTIYAAGRTTAGGGGGSWNRRAFFSSTSDFNSTTAVGNGNTIIVASALNADGNGGQQGFEASYPYGVNGGFGGGGYAHENNLSAGGGGYYGGWENQGSSIYTNNLSVQNPSATYTDPYDGSTQNALNACSFIETSGTSNISVISYSDLGAVGTGVGSVTIASV